MKNIKTPLRIEELLHSVRNSRGEVVAEWSVVSPVSGSSYITMFVREPEAAQEIVQALNSHDALIEALRYSTCGEETHCQHNRCAKAREALNLAGGL